MNIQTLQEHFHTCMPLFIALGDEVRLTIIEALTTAAYNQRDLPLSSNSHGMNVMEITRHTNLSRPAVSHHLKILKSAGLVDIRREGTSNYYHLTITEGTRQLMQLGAGLQQILPKDE